MRSSVSAVSILWAACLALGGGALSARESDAPNVILVITDDQGYGDVGAHGNEMIRTPVLDRLHSESVRLTDFHVDPTCSPTRSALMSGRYSTRTGVWHTIMGRSLMNPRELTVAEVFAANGYRCGMFGKWHLGDAAPCRPQDQGFHEAFYHGGGGVGQGPDWWENDYFDDTYLRNGVPEKVEGYCTDVWFREAMRFIDGHREEPFFLYLSTNAPHGPYLVEERWWKPYHEKGVPEGMARFYGMIENIDENMGRLLAKLDETGLAEDTILIFMTDNGSAAGWRAPARWEGAWKGYNAGMRDGKGSEHDGGHRVPFFVRWPRGRIGGGRDVPRLSAHIDVLPTLVDLCSLRKPEGPALDGMSLAPLLRGEPDTLPDRALYVHSQRIPYPQKWRKCAVMTERWRLVNGRALYDIVADPGQRTDLSAEHPDLVKRLRDGYEDWWQSLSASFDEMVRYELPTTPSETALFHSHDWHVTDQRLSAWHQNHVRSGHIGNGFWAVRVAEAGEYEISLRRWPKELDRGLDAVRARLKIGDVDVTREVSADDTHATFRVRLAAGDTRLESWLTLPDGRERGAYFVYSRRIGDR